MYNVEIENALKQLAAQEAEDQKAAKDLEAAKKKQDDSELVEDIIEEDIIEETYSDEELDDMVGKVYNCHKIENIYLEFYKHYRLQNSSDDVRLLFHLLILIMEKL